MPKIAPAPLSELQLAMIALRDNPSSENADIQPQLASLANALERRLLVARRIDKLLSDMDQQGEHLERMANHATQVISACGEPEAVLRDQLLSWQAITDLATHVHPVVGAPTREGMACGQKWQCDHASVRCDDTRQSAAYW